MSDRDLPSLNALRAFEAAARLGSMSFAAQELHVTHGAVSRQVRALEEALGQPLFARQGRGVALTATGQQLREQCSSAFGQLREGWLQLRNAHAASACVLGCSGSVLARWVIPRLERLRHELPALTLHLAVQEEPVVDHLANVDAALLLAAPPWPSGWQVHELAPERIGPVLSPRYPGADRLRELLVGPIDDDARVAEALALLRASAGMAKAKDTVSRYAAQAREELAALPDVPGRQALATLVDYTIHRHG